MGKIIIYDMSDQMTPEDIKQIIIATAGTNKGAPATAKFCRMYGLSESTVRDHLNGSRGNLDKTTRALYRVLATIDEPEKVATPKRLKGTEAWMCDCTSVLWRQYNYCFHCGAMLIWKKTK